MSPLGAGGWQNIAPWKRASPIPPDDTKGVLDYSWERHRMSVTPESIVNALDALVAEMVRRKRLVEKDGLDALDEARSIAIIVDDAHTLFAEELADGLLGEKREAALDLGWRVRRLLNAMVRGGKDTGIHLLVSSATDPMRNDTPRLPVELRAKLVTVTMGKGADPHNVVRFEGDES